MPEHFFKNNLSGRSIHRKFAISLEENNVDPESRAKYTATEKNF